MLANDWESIILRQLGNQPSILEMLPLIVNYEGVGMLFRPLDAHQNEPVSAQNNGPGKCAGLGTARSLAGLGTRFAPTIRDETRG